MEIDTYKSIGSKSKYLSVPHGVDPSTIDLENNDKKWYGDPDLTTKITMDISIHGRIALSKNDVKKQIDEKGYAIHGVETRTEEKSIRNYVF